VISGGSWGFAMWLYDNEQHDTLKHIFQSLHTHKDKWGPEIPLDEVRTNWFDFWSQQVEMHVMDKTPGWNHDTSPSLATARQKLVDKGLPNTQVYFVFESVTFNSKKKLGKKTLLGRKIKRVTITNKLKHFGDFLDYCYVTIGPQQHFSCLRSLEVQVPLDQLQIDQRNTEVDRPIHLIDVLSYCSSAWSTLKGLTNVHAHVTRRFTAGENTYRLVDAGGTLNDPLMMYFVDDRFRGSTVLNFDFSGYDSLEENNLKEVKKFFQEFMSDYREMDHVENQITGSGTGRCYHYEIDGKVLKHIPLFGAASREHMGGFFPTMRRNIKAMLVQQWNLMRLKFFEEDWSKTLGEVDALTCGR